MGLFDALQVTDRETVPRLVGTGVRKLRHLLTQRAEFQNDRETISARKAEMETVEIAIRVKEIVNIGQIKDGELLVGAHFLQPLRDINAVGIVVLGMEVILILVVSMSPDRMHKPR